MSTQSGRHWAWCRDKDRKDSLLSCGIPSWSRRAVKERVHDSMGNLYQKYRSMNRWCLEEEMPHSVLENQGRHPLYSSANILKMSLLTQLGEGKCSLVFCILMFGLSFWKCQFHILSYRNQGLLIDDPLKIATGSHVSFVCVKWWH